MLNTSDFKSKNFRAEDVESENGVIWAIWGHNIFTHKLQLWCIAELKAYNDLAEIQAAISLLISGKG